MTDPQGGNIRRIGPLRQANQQIQSRPRAVVPIREALSIALLFVGYLGIAILAAIMWGALALFFVICIDLVLLGTALGFQKMNS